MTGPDQSMRLNGRYLNEKRGLIREYIYYEYIY